MGQTTIAPPYSNRSRFIPTLVKRPNQSYTEFHRPVNVVDILDASKVDVDRYEFDYTMGLNESFKFLHGRSFF